ncbi:Peptidyl-prolyl isomerase cwc27 [Eufriesea mexicana]|uniref:Peptidyl-prolyl isomerase cwc27 n=1 Tax=Eufriesea mexicana TaxID=516756 RepID=A0A310S7R3_9HYME|nr:Peptidyl-prolyl isomerase cwc27 [Eufriesea mexicana]
MKTVRKEIAYYLESGNRKEAAHVSRKIDVWFPYGNMRTIEEMKNEHLNDRPLYPPRLMKTIILDNAFSNIIPRIIVQESEVVKDSSKTKTAAVKNFYLLSFGEEAEEDEKESLLNHLANKKWKKDRSRNWESDDEVKTQEELEVIKKGKKAKKERINSKLRNTKKEPKKVENYKINDVEDDKDIKENE